MSKEPTIAIPSAAITQGRDTSVSASVDRTRRALIQQTAIMLIVVGAVAIVIASHVASLSWKAGAIATLGLTICAGSIALARSRLPVQFAANFLIASWLAALFATACLRGGLGAPLMIALPTVPVIAATVISRRAAWIVTGVILFGLVVLYLVKYGGRVVPQALQPDFQYDLMRAFWVAISSLIATKLATFVTLRSNGLALRLERLAMTDALTGIMNRGAISALLEAEVSRARRCNEALSILMVDVDHFKILNDSQGHLAGDVALARIADTMTRLLRGGGDAVGRWGGEEFLVVLPHANQRDALGIAERIQRAINDLDIPNNTDFADHVTVTIGVAGGTDIVSASHLLQLADRAMYEGKAEGRNRVRG